MRSSIRRADESSGDGCGTACGCGVSGGDCVCEENRCEGANGKDLISMGKLDGKTLSLALILLMGSVCCAQTVDRPNEPHKPNQLPGEYSGFSEADVLGKIFD